METFVYYAPIMNVVWHTEITALALAFPMDIKFQLIREIEHSEMKGPTNIDAMQDRIPKLNQFNILLLH